MEDIIKENKGIEGKGSGGNNKGQLIKTKPCNFTFSFNLGIVKNISAAVSI